MERAGFRCLAAIDSNAEAIATYRANFPLVADSLDRDLTKFPPEKLAARIGVDHVDVIVGGPPCQGFSNVRQVDAANHGSRVRRDKRRYLYRVFLEYVSWFQPLVFVMENVLGIQSAAKGKFYTLVQSEARALGYRVHAQVEEAWKLGVPQKRRRQLIIGVRSDVAGYFPATLRPAPRAIPAGGVSTAPVVAASLFAEDALPPPPPCPTLWDAIGDLPPLAAGEGASVTTYDLSRREAFLTRRGPCARNYVERVLEVSRAQRLTAHIARPQSERDLGDFAKLREGEHSAEAIARGETMAFPYDRTCFLDRYKRQHREELCSTIVAHLSKDGLMFVHPTQLRSLTPREAARVQSFPDHFTFPVPRTHQFRIIGNAVPPLVSEAVGIEIKNFLKQAFHASNSPRLASPAIPKDDKEAVERICSVLDVSLWALRRLTNDQFKQTWFAIGFLYTGLHPEGAVDHGKTIRRTQIEGGRPAMFVEPRLCSPFYERSGWPVALEPIAREAWRRHRNGELTEQDLYCSEAHLAGVEVHNPYMTESYRQGRAKIAA